MYYSKFRSPFRPNNATPKQRNAKMGRCDSTLLTPSMWACGGYPTVACTGGRAGDCIVLGASQATQRQHGAL